MLKLGRRDSPASGIGAPLRDFQHVADVEAWIQAGGDVGELYALTDPDHIARNIENIIAVRAWFRLQEDRRQDAMLAANKAAASAAASSASAAREAVQWSRWAAVIAVAALFVAALPHIKLP